MAEPVKLLPEEVQRLKSFQARFRILTSQYGEAYFQQKMVDAELKLIDDQMEELESDRIGYMQELMKKYGAGTVNLSTGEFVTESEPEPVSPPNPNA